MHSGRARLFGERAAAVVQVCGEALRRAKEQMKDEGLDNSQVGGELLAPAEHLPRYLFYQVCLAVAMLLAAAVKRRPIPLWLRRRGDRQLSFKFASMG